MMDANGHQTQPLVSVLLSVKNGLPHLKLAIESVRRQTFRDFELVVHDGASTDGSLEYLRSLTGIPGLSIESAPDAGIGDGYTRCIARSRGGFVCILSSDEYFEDDALEMGISWLAAHPEAVVVNGAVRLTDADDHPVQVYAPPRFSFLGHLVAEVVLPFSGFLNRKRIGPDLFFDNTRKTCPDYDLWIRLGSRFPSTDFVSKPEIFKTARADRASMSFRVESFDQFCKDKLFFLNRFLDAQPPGPVVDTVRASAAAGVFLWAAESVLNLEGPSPAFLHWCRQAAAHDSGSPRLARLSERTHAFTIAATGELSTAPAVQPPHPSAGAVAVEGLLDLRRVTEFGAGTTTSYVDGTLEVTTPVDSWAYAALFQLSEYPRAVDSTYWARLDLEVLHGQVGVGTLVGDILADEQFVSSSAGRTTRFIPIPGDNAVGIMLRNGALPRAAVARLFDLTVERAPGSKPDARELTVHQED